MRRPPAQILQLGRSGTEALQAVLAALVCLPCCVQAMWSWRPPLPPELLLGVPHPTGPPLALFCTLEEIQNLSFPPKIKIWIEKASGV